MIKIRDILEFNKWIDEVGNHLDDQQLQIGFQILQELTKRIKDHWPKIKILVLSAYDFDKYIEILAKLGIDGYILKDSPQETLIQALRDVISGGVVLPPSIASKVMKGFTASKRANNSEKEKGFAR